MIDALTISSIVVSAISAISIFFSRLKCKLFSCSSCCCSSECMRNSHICDEPNAEQTKI